MKLPASLFSRRAFLDGLLGGWLAALAAAFVEPVLRFVVPPTREPDRVDLPLADFAGLGPDAVRPFAWGGKPGLLKRAADGAFVAFVGVCTHLDCNVTYLAAEKRFYCACHDGWYDENGVNGAGPPPKPLRRLSVAVEGDVLVVTRQEGA